MFSSVRSNAVAPVEFCAVHDMPAVTSTLLAHGGEVKLSVQP